MDSLDSLFPALGCLAQLSLRRLLAQLDAAGVRVGDVRKDTARECARRPRIADHQSTLPERSDGVLDVRHFQSEVIESGRTLGIRLLQLDEGVPAHLDVSRHQLPLRIRVPHDFTKSQLLPVPGQRLRNVRHADGNVVQPHCRLSRRALRDSRLNDGSDQNPRNEQKETTHRQLPSQEEVLKLDESCISDPKSEILNWTEFNMIFRISDLRCRIRPISKSPLSLK